MRDPNSVFRVLLRKMREHGPDRTWWIRTALATGVRIVLWFAVGALTHS